MSKDTTRIRIYAFVKEEDSLLHCGNIAESALCKFGGRVGISHNVSTRLTVKSAGGHVARHREKV